MFSIKLAQKRAGSIGTLLFGIFWTLFSSIFVIVGLWLAWSSLKKSGWEKTPCQVSEFKIRAKKNKDPAFTPIVKYSYNWEDQQYTGTKVNSNSNGSDDYEKLAELQYKFRLEKIQNCYVNPENPSEAALEEVGAGSVAGGLAFTAFGAIFVLIGMSIIFSGRKKKQTLSDEGQANTGKVTTATGFIIGFLFFGAFALGGGLAAIGLWGKYSETKATQQWEETPSEVIWSRVVTNSDSDGNTYRPEIFYSYQYDNLKFRSNKYERFESSSSGYEGKKTIVKQFPKKKKILCYVNPEKPWQAVIKRELGMKWLWLLFPIPFLLIGFGGVGFLIYVLVTGKDFSKNEYQKKSTKKDLNLKDQVIFKPGRKRALWLLGSIAIALFWNGIVSVFLVELYSGWKAGSFDTFLGLFLIPFVLVGTGMILHVFYRFLALFGPKPKVTLSPGYLVMGDSTQLNWEIPSGRQKISEYSVTLIGEEEAQYERGTSTVTDSACFYRETIVEQSKTYQANQGRATISLPLNGVVQSWESDHNAVKWKLEVKGKIYMFPDIKDSYEITVISPSSKILS